MKEKVEGLGPVQLTEDKIKEQLATIKVIQTILHNIHGKHIKITDTR